MPDLIQGSLYFFPATIVIALLLMSAPLLGKRGRVTIAALFAAAGLLLVGDVLVIDHSGMSTLGVPNVFPRNQSGETYVWTTATVTAPAWHWHVFLAAMLLVPAVLLFARRNREPGTPNPVFHGMLVFVYLLTMRLGLELTAAPVQVVWAIGGTPSLLGILPFFGWYCGQRRYGFGKFVVALLGLAYAQRVWIIAWGWLATTQQLGTHLDTHVVTDTYFFGETLRFESAEETWQWLTLIPHAVMWIAVTLALGLLLATGPFLLARRRAVPREVAVEELATS